MSHSILKAAVDAAQLEKDTDTVALMVRRRALCDMDTTVGDVLSTTFLTMTRYRGVVRTDYATVEDMRHQAETYTRTLLRRVAEQNPRLASRIRL